MRDHLRISFQREPRADTRRSRFFAGREAVGFPHRSEKTQTVRGPQRALAFCSRLLPPASPAPRTGLRHVVPTLVPSRSNHVNEVEAMTEKLDEPKPVVPSLEVIVVDPNKLPVQYVDWIVTGGLGGNGVLNLALAAVDFTILVDGKLQAVVQTKLRMSVPTATNLHRFLGELLTATAGRPAPPNPPANTLN
jgi:hypothetical protein